MNVGIVSVWFNRGQATVARLLRRVLTTLGHRTCVLARPTRPSFVKPRFVAEEDVWAQPDVTRASAYLIPGQEYLDWARANGLEVVFCDQNYQFDEIAALRQGGVRTIGRFVWEDFAEAHVAGARAAYDCVYSVTRCEQSRYRTLGIDSPLVRWGWDPDLAGWALATPSGPPRFFYPGGFLSPRKPTGAVLAAFRAAAIPSARLIVKCQRTIRRRDLVVPESQADLEAREGKAFLSPDELAALRADNPGVDFVFDDLPWRSYVDLFAGCHVCICPSRWEGLGLHLYEAVALGLPCLCNRMPPLDEVVVDGVSGVLTACRAIGHRKNGLPIMEPDVPALASAMRELSDPGRLERLQAGTRARRVELVSDRTVADVGALLRGTP
jgi:glycosyltransferase involved in cell wall biosynthesis